MCIFLWNTPKSNIFPFSNYSSDFSSKCSTFYVQKLQMPHFPIWFWKWGISKNEHVINFKAEKEPKIKFWRGPKSFMPTVPLIPAVTHNLSSSLIIVVMEVVVNSSPDSILIRTRPVINIFSLISTQNHTISYSSDKYRGPSKWFFLFSNGKHKLSMTSNKN